MIIDDLITQLKPRAQRLGLIDPAVGLVDEDELKVYVRSAAQYFANRYQLQHFLNMNRELFRTSASVESYTIPANYGFIAPDDTRRSGIAAADSDGTNTTNLEYYEPVRFNLIRSTTESKPAWFTVIGNLMYFGPIPDAIYIIEAVERAVQDGEEIPEPYVAAVETETLWRMAADQGKATQVLADERLQLTRSMVNNEARTRQKFYTSRERVGSGRTSRRY